MKRTQLGVFILLVLIPWFSGCDSVTPDYTNFFVKYYGEDGQQQGVDLLVDPDDNSLVLLGTMYQPNSTFKRIYVVKTDWDGNVIWTRRLDGSNDAAKDIEFSNEGGYIILAETRDASDNADVKIVKIDRDGNEVASVVYGSPVQNGVFPNDYPETITYISDSYIVTGTTEYVSGAGGGTANSTDALHLRFDFDLLLFDAGRFYFSTGESENDYGIKTVKLNDDRFYLFGTSQISYEGPVNDDFNFWFFGMNNGGVQSGRKGIIGQDLNGVDEKLHAVCPAFSNGFFLVGTYTNNLTNSDIYIAQLYESGGELTKAQGGGNLAIYNGSEARNIVPVAVCQSYFSKRGFLIAGNEGEPDATNIWLSKVDETGMLLWSTRFGSNNARNNDQAGAVAELPDGKIIVLGTVNLNVTNLKMALFKLNGEGRLAN